MSTSFPSRHFICSASKSFWCALKTLISFGAMIGSTLAADASYSNVAPDQHMKEWVLLGPIPAQEADAKPSFDNARKMGLERDLLEQAGGEAKINPEVGMKFAFRGGEYTWRSHESADDAVDLIDVLGQHDFTVAYAAAAIESPEEKTALVGLGSDDGVRVWLNGELIHENSTPRALTVDDDVFAVKLKKGTNRLLIKVVNDQGAWGYSFRFLSPDTLAKRLFKAASDGKAEIVEELVSLGVDIDARPSAGITAAQIAKAPPCTNRLPTHAATRIGISAPGLIAPMSVPRTRGSRMHATANCQMAELARIVASIL